MAALTSVAVLAGCGGEAEPAPPSSGQEAPATAAPTPTDFTVLAEWGENLPAGRPLRDDRQRAARHPLGRGRGPRPRRLQQPRRLDRLPRAGRGRDGAGLLDRLGRRPGSVRGRLAAAGGRHHRGRPGRGVRAAAAYPRDASEPVTIDGHDGVTITLSMPSGTVPSDCPDGGFDLWVSDPGGGRYLGEPGRYDQLWILDVEGQVLVIQAGLDSRTSGPRADRILEMIESVEFVPRPE